MFNNTIHNLVGGHQLKGEVGIEIELEGHTFLTEMPSYWRYENDGSLRGENAEYVLNTPVERHKVSTALKYLEKKLDHYGTHINNSERTSVHVHINCQRMNETELVNFIVMYYIFEKHLLNFCGESRKGNLFCLSASDADFVLNQLTMAIKEEDVIRILGNDLRYAALNLSALGKYGSLEFRAMRGVSDFNIINTWVELLLSLKDAALEYNEPREIIEQVSMQGPLEFAANVFKDNVEVITDSPTFDDDIMEGIWVSQDIAYAFSEYLYKRRIQKMALKHGRNEEEAVVERDAPVERIEPNEHF